MSNDYGNYTTYHFDDVDEMSDYESTGAPPPPPPADDDDAPPVPATTTTALVDGVPKDDLEANSKAIQKNKLNDTLATDPEAGEYGDMAEDDDDGEDGSVEIPPTKVVEEMVRREQKAAGIPTKPGSGGNNKVMMGVVGCLLVSLAVLLGVGFGTGTFGSSSEATANTSTTGTEADGTTGNTRPSGNPTDAVAETTRGAAMRDFLSDTSLGGPDVFADLASPESLALQWLVLEDPLQLDATNTQHQFQLTQRYALSVLWFHSDFTWANETNWLNDDECTWFGITCMALGANVGGAGTSDNATTTTVTTTQQVVTRINLEGNNVQGSIPQDLALLGFLTSLNLADNVLEGSLPASLGSDMVTLQELLLDRNLLDMDLSGYDWSGLADSLVLLDLSSNSLQGTLPDSLWTLVTLEMLVLDNNAFTGALSGPGLAKLTNLVRFTIGGNQLSDNLPEELGSMENLEVLWLFKNQFSGPLLESWGPSLIVLDVYENQLTGEIPGDSLANLENLQQLVLGGNRFTGPIPNALGDLAQLSVLNLENNALTGDFPDTMASLEGMTILRVGNNPGLGGGDALPDVIFETMSDLEELRVHGLGLTGNLNDKDWSALPNLRVVDLSNNDLEAFPNNITVCEDLEELNLSDNPRLGGGLPDSIDDLSNLKSLFVRNAGLVGNLTASVGNLESLEFLDLSNNTLLGSLPEFEGASSIQEIKLGTNFFTGEIPESYGDLGRLQVLDLSVNFLGGDIPESLGNAESLTIIKLGDNANEAPVSGFTGQLPASFGNLKNLVQLEVYSNRLTDTLPVEWGALENLQTLDVEFNPIEGTVPAEYSGMTSLQEFYLSNTGIEGAVPEEVCADSLQFFVVDCDVVCTCCSRCVEEGTSGRVR